MCPQKDSLWKEEFVAPIVKIIKGICDYEIEHFSENFNAANYDKIIISGSPLGDFESMGHIDKFKWILDTEKPVFGICAGMQIIAKIFGCDLHDCQEIGMTKVKTLMGNKLFEGEFEVYSLHNSGVGMNENLNILAESGKCIQAIKHKEKEIYGVLFHPEVRNHDMIIKFLNS